MTIQTKLFDGVSVKTRTYRKVIKGMHLAQYVEGFYMQRDFNKWGVLIQLKGKERILLRSFGKLESGETVTHLGMIENIERKQ